jgi:UDP-2,3-diacylglucosamine pyrophosphatase LpxH
MNLIVNHISNNKKVERLILNRFPIVIVSDIHNSLDNLIKVRELHKDCECVCLGDIVDLWDKNGNDNHKKILDYFIENKIPTILGNHDEFMAANSKYKLSEKQDKYIQNLPFMFVLETLDKKTHKCYHYKPNDIWSMEDNSKIDFDKFCEWYGYDHTFVSNVIAGHTHKQFIKSFKETNCKYVGVGSLKYGEYGLLFEDGIIHLHRLNSSLPRQEN